MRSECSPVRFSSCFLLLGPVRPYCLAIQSLIESARVAGRSPARPHAQACGQVRLRRNAIHYAGAEQTPDEPDRPFVAALFATWDQFAVTGLRSQFAYSSGRTPARRSPRGVPPGRRTCGRGDLEQLTAATSVVARCVIWAAHCRFCLAVEKPRPRRPSTVRAPVWNGLARARTLVAP